MTAKRRTTKIVYEALQVSLFAREPTDRVVKTIIDGGPDVDVAFDVATSELHLHGQYVNLTIPHVRCFRIENVEVETSVYEG